MCSGTALTLLKAEDGFDTTWAGSCFWELRPGGLSAFARFFHAMLERGFYFPPAQLEAAFVSLAHAESDVDATIAAAREAFGAARAQ